ncbi:MAG: nucleotidyltransferase family protein [Bacteroidia bacterium]|nr:nucleotidyltransferase family protein [Bacteroidia bacterium]
MDFKKECILLAGGMGTRLKSVISDIPKPMAPVAGKPFLTYLFQYLFKHGIQKTVLSVGYKHEVILETYGSNFKNIELDYAVETQPLGTGGGIRLALEKCESEHIFIVNGDTFFDVSLKDLMDAHTEKDADLTIAVKFMENFNRYGSLTFDEHERITAFQEKKAMEAGFINGGIYVLKKSFLLNLPLPDKFSFESDVMEKYYATARFNVFTGSSTRYFIDIGIPEDYERAQREFYNPKDAYLP